jgi:CHAT domain-containing protein/tetratricopeptide (TPR) repeat protein
LADRQHHHVNLRLVGAGLAAALALFGASAHAQVSPRAAESFTIGSGGTFCEAQGVALGAARKSIFDRKWAILCPEVARPVGSAFALRGASEAAARVAGGRDEALACEVEETVRLNDVGAVVAGTCRGTTSGAPWRTYRVRAGNTVYVVEGLAGYDGALRLALRNLVADRLLSGDVAVATTGAGDAAAMLRARAAVTDPATLLGQGYRRNNAGAYAEAAEFFQALDGGPPPAGADGDRLRLRHEQTVNRALQLSNLGEFQQAARLFASARESGAQDPVLARLSRNFEAIDALNRGDTAAVMATLDRPVPQLAAGLASPSGVEIDRSLAAALNSGGRAGALLGQEASLSPAERALVLDAQALQLRGTVARLSGRLDEALQAFSTADGSIATLRDGRVVSAIRLRGQILSEMALTREAQGRGGEAEALLRQALQLVSGQYPDSATANAGRARLAAFLTRQGKAEEAGTLYREVVDDVVGTRGALVGIANLIQPYFRTLTEPGSANTAGAADLFLAAQLVERPGASSTLAALARQLEGGDGAAADLFRQSLALSREIERNRIALQRGGLAAADLTTLQDKQQRLLARQAELLGALSAYPKFRSASRGYLTLAELRGLLKPGEAYLKLAELGDELYAVWIDGEHAAGWRVAGGAPAVGELVARLRDSISSTINGVQATYPFDIEAAAMLSDGLLAPVSGRLANVRHLIFEPDGALLQLPANLLLADKAGVDAYRRRVAAGGDEYDMRGIAWLGRNRAISTALSAASFRDARNAPASAAPQAYLGMGENQPANAAAVTPAALRSGVGGAGQDCDWPLAAWNRPIDAGELRVAAGAVGAQRAAIVTGAAFSDSAIKARSDLDGYRIVHFATHGLVTPPRDGCPARPALLTSFGNDPQSDGLLRFEEIFELGLDADLVVLSACDTAAAASLEATREAGIATGGGQALDGLVRAFIGAGGRMVIASHWPAPDEFGATARLFSTLLGHSSGDTIGGALERAQRQLMDDPQTSHPFYWSGFALIGDGERPLHRAN